MVRGAADGRCAMTWATGVAEVIGTSPTGVVNCPHCRETHTHMRSSVGSNHVVAGCHAGYTRCREYRVVDMGAGRGRR